MMGCLRPWCHMPSLLPNLVPASSPNLHSFFQQADSSHTCLSVHSCLWDCEGRLTPCWGAESWTAPCWGPAPRSCSSTPHFSLSFLQSLLQAATGARAPARLSRTRARNRASTGQKEVLCRDLLITKGIVSKQGKAIAWDSACMCNRR